MVADPFVIETADLRKQYGTVEALRGLTLRVPGGAMFGCLGRNGSGKTTTIKVLLGMARPDGGTARVFGLAADRMDSSLEIRRRTGFVSEEKDLYEPMTVAEIVRFTASFYPRWRSDLQKHYLDAFDLPLDRKVKALSRGMRTKIALLLALCRGASLLVLDEPTSGLDPAMGEEVLQAIVSHVAREEVTVFFSSHQIAEVEQIADHVAIIDHGKSVLSGALDDIRDHYRRIQLVFADAAPEPAFRTPGIERVQRDGRVLTLFSSADTDAILDEARALGVTAADVAPVTLKDIFLENVRREG
jgi:ABC-2 type transport system ATP-binding protein